MDISNKSVIELKAIAYDLLVQLEQVRSNIDIINKEIAKKQQAEKVIEVK